MLAVCVGCAELFTAYLPVSGQREPLGSVFHSFDIPGAWILWLIFPRPSLQTWTLLPLFSILSLPHRSHTFSSFRQLYVSKINLHTSEGLPGPNVFKQLLIWLFWLNAVHWYKVNKVIFTRLQLSYIGFAPVKFVSSFAHLPLTLQGNVITGNNWTTEASCGIGKLLSPSLELRLLQCVICPHSQTTSKCNFLHSPHQLSF